MKYLTVLLCSSSIFAMTNCENLSKVQSEIYASALNIANADITRTEEGGPFLKRKVGDCSAGKCEILKLSDETDFLFVYDPNHPDANEAGYIKKPLIEKKNEMANLHANVTYLRSIARKSRCGVKIRKFGDSLLVQYPKLQSVKVDVINKDKSIVRTWKNGKNEIINL